MDYIIDAYILGGWQAVTLTAAVLCFALALKFGSKRS